jgi:hypothetical protein
MDWRTLIPQLYRISTGWLLSSRRPCNLAAFHPGRCGSRVLGDLLDQIPGIFWDGELFSPGRLRDMSSRWKHLPGDRMKILDIRMKLAGSSCYGFETQPTQLRSWNLSTEDYVQMLANRGFDRFILLHRKNHLRRLVSVLSARQASQWHVDAGQTPPPSCIRLDPQGFSLNWGPDTDKRPLISHLEQSELEVRQLEQALDDRRPLRLTYEEHIEADPKIACRRICEFAGVEYHPVTVRFQKANVAGLADLLTNFEDVERALRGTRFAWMLDS